AAWYLVLVIGYVLTFPSQSNHFLTALGFFLFIPSLFGGFAGFCAGVVSAPTKAALQQGVESGTLTRPYAFVAGLLAGITSMVGSLAFFARAYALSHSEVSVFIALGGIGAVLAGSPFLGLWLLKRKSALSSPNRVGT